MSKYSVKCEKRSKNKIKGKTFNCKRFGELAIEKQVYERYHTDGGLFVN